MLQIQNVEILGRMRRFFGLVGDARIDVSEVASPVVIAADVSQAPYRLDGIGFHFLATKGALAGAFSGFSTRMPANSDRAVIDQISIYNGNAGSSACRVYVTYNSAELDTPDLPRPAFTTEYRDPIVAPSFEQTVPLQVVTGTSTTEFLRFSELDRIIQPAGTWTVLPMNLVLRAGVNLSMRTEVNNQFFLASFRGRYFVQRD